MEGAKNDSFFNMTFALALASELFLGVYKQYIKMARNHNSVAQPNENSVILTSLSGYNPETTTEVRRSTSVTVSNRQVSPHNSQLHVNSEQNIREWQTCPVSGTNFNRPP